MKLLYLRKLVACTLLPVFALSTANAWELEASVGTTDERQTA